MITMRKAALMFGGLAAMVLAAPAGEARAQGYGYAVISIRNSTNAVIHYSFKWGTDGNESEQTLEPGEGLSHHIPLDDDGRAPSPYVGFDADLTGDVYWKEYRLDFYARPYRGGGKPYRFSRSGALIEFTAD